MTREVRYPDPAARTDELLALILGELRAVRAAVTPPDPEPGTVDLAEPRKQPPGGG